MAVGYNCIIAVVRTCYPREDQHHNVTFSSVSSHSPTVPTSTPGRWRFSTTSSTQHSLSGDSTDLGSFSQSESLQVGLGHRPSLRRSHTAPVLFQWKTFDCSLLRILIRMMFGHQVFDHHMSLSYKFVPHLNHYLLSNFQRCYIEMPQLWADC